MKYQINKGKEGLKISFSGDLTISCAGEIKQALLGVMQKKGDIFIDLSEVQDIDVTALQLICAVHRSTLRDGRSLSLEKGLSQGLKDLVRIAGFARDRGCSLYLHGTCFWKRMEEP